MSDTPRTDVVQRGPGAGSFFAMLEHARQLERENNDLRTLLEADKAFIASKGFTTLTELLEDKKRLDWAQERGAIGMRYGRKFSVAQFCEDPGFAGPFYVDASLRGAIDAARKATP